MEWVRVQTNLFAHEKTRLAGLMAMGVWTMGLTYCGLHETDGHIPYEALATFGPLPAVNRSAARLVAVGFWHQTNGGYRMHNWPLYQASRDNGKLVRHQRKYVAAKMREWSDARARATSDARREERRGEESPRQLSDEELRTGLGEVRRTLDQHRAKDQLPLFQEGA
jgi:hypothetical protein